MLLSISRLLHDETAATSIEYAAMASLLALAVIAGARSIGVKLSTNYYSTLGNNLS